MAQADNADLYIVDFSVHDVRFPTNLQGDGTDAMNTECDYSAAYLILYTGPKGAHSEQKETQKPPLNERIGSGVPGLRGYGMTFTIGRGNEICCAAIASLVKHVLLGRNISDLFLDMGATWRELVTDCQLRWVGPEKGVIHLASAACVNAVWDMYARQAGKPLWLLIAEMAPRELVRLAPFQYISDLVTPEEALEIFSEGVENGKRDERIASVKSLGYPAYTTSAGWSGYDDEKVARLTRSALAQGFSHFKLKVGASMDDDRRRLRLVRRIIDDESEMPKDRHRPAPASVQGKNAGPTGSVLMIDANQVFDVNQAIDYVAALAEFKPWFIEEPTSPDDILGHARIRKALLPLGMGVATGEHAHSRVMFKQLLQAEAVDVVQVDACRLAGPNEVLAVMLMAKKCGKLVCPHAGGVGLCEYVQHLGLLDYVCVSKSMDRNVLEWVDHLHEHFVDPARVSANGRYIAPSQPGYSMEMIASSIEDYTFPTGSYWTSGVARTACQ